MILYHFNSLDEKMQAEAIWEHGVHIADRIEGAFKLILYQIESFYVEVWYNPAENSILKFRSFSSTTPLEPYLEKIDIPI